MSKFFVGQRVRIIRSENWPELAGKEGRVVGFMTPTEMDQPSCEIVVSPDVWGSGIAPYPGRFGHGRFAPHGSQLEPILPEGSAPSEFTFQQLMDNLQEVMA